MTDLQADIVTNAGRALVPFDQINQKMIMIERSTKRANAAMRDFQGSAMNAAGAGGGMTMQKGLRSTRKIVGIAGGGVLGKIFGGMGLEGNFGRAAAGVGVLTFAYKALDAVSHANAERLKIRIDAEKEYGAAIQRGSQIVQEQAKAGFGRAPSRRALLAAGGTEAVNAATQLAGNGIIGEDEARSATAKIFSKFGNTPRARMALQLFDSLSRVGISPNEAMARVLKGGRNLDSSASAYKLSETDFKEQTGGKGTLKQAQMNVLGDPLLESARTDQRLRLPMGNLQEAAAIKDQGAQARADLARATNPIMTEIGDLNRAQDAKIAAMERMAAEEGNIIRAMRNLGMLFGGEGSGRNQLEREQSNRPVVFGAQ